MYRPPILKKAIQILKLLIEEYQPLGLMEVARRLSISKSTVLGILRGFHEEGLVSKDGLTKKYTVGKEMMRLSKMLFRGQDLVFIARPYLENLAERVDETVFLGVWERDMVKIIEVIEAKKGLKISSPIRTKLPITAGAIGKIFLSTMSNEGVVAYLGEKGLHRYTENSITDINVFIKEIEQVRRLGYSVDMGEYLKGIRAVASFIRRDGDPIGTVWLVGFSNSMIDERLEQIIRDLSYAADQISTRLSFSSVID